MGKGADAGFNPAINLAQRLKLSGESAGFLEHLENVRALLGPQRPAAELSTPEPDVVVSTPPSERGDDVNTFCQVPCLQSSLVTADSVVSPMLISPGQYVGVIYTTPARRRAPKAPSMQRLLPVEVLECLVKTSDNSFYFVGRVFETAATLLAGGMKLEDHVALVRREVLYTTVTKTFSASAIIGPCEVFYQRDSFVEWEKRMPSDRRFLCRYIVQEKTPRCPSPGGGRVASMSPLTLTKKRQLDSRLFGPQSQVLPSDSSTLLPDPIRDHYWLVLAELVEKRMGVRKSCQRAECELHMPPEAFAACIEVLGTPETKDGTIVVESDDFDRLQRTVFRSFRTFPLRVLDAPSAKKKRYQMPQEFRRNDRAEARGPFRFELHTNQWPTRLTVSFTYVIRASGFGVVPPLPLALLTAPPKSKKLSRRKTPAATVPGGATCSLIEI